MKKLHWLSIGSLILALFNNNLYPARPGQPVWHNYSPKEYLLRKKVDALIRTLYLDLKPDSKINIAVFYAFVPAGLKILHNTFFSSDQKSQAKTVSNSTPSGPPPELIKVFTKSGSKSETFKVFKSAAQSMSKEAASAKASEGTSTATRILMSFAMFYASYYFLKQTKNATLANLKAAVKQTQSDYLNQRLTSISPFIQVLSYLNSWNVYEAIARVKKFGKVYNPLFEENIDQDIEALVNALLTDKSIKSNPLESLWQQDTILDYLALYQANRLIEKLINSQVAFTIFDQESRRKMEAQEQREAAAQARGAAPLEAGEAPEGAPIEMPAAPEEPLKDERTFFSAIFQIIHDYNTDEENNLDKDTSENAQSRRLFIHSLLTTLNTQDFSFKGKPTPQIKQKFNSLYTQATAIASIPPHKESWSGWLYRSIAPTSWTAKFYTFHDFLNQPVQEKLFNMIWKGNQTREHFKFLIKDKDDLNKFAELPAEEERFGKREAGRRLHDRPNERRPASATSRRLGTSRDSQPFQQLLHSDDEKGD